MDIQKKIPESFKNYTSEHDAGNYETTEITRLARLLYSKFKKYKIPVRIENNTLSSYASQNKASAEGNMEDIKSDDLFHKHVLIQINKYNDGMPYMEIGGLKDRRLGSKIIKSATDEFNSSLSPSERGNLKSIWKDSTSGKLGDRVLYITIQPKNNAERTLASKNIDSMNGY